ncbi:hypothetical protein [Allorhizocola rhizosphaerae]|uniref:hypothetical protein n=1 Tax=Allorhizocola rhizosphaerae TaxID=1872709 RepID=UPI0013C2FE3B|nr:hypothetical protein [Allorhizocola rhizosphaerae]
MRTERVTEGAIDECRKLARLQPATGLPELARCLMTFAVQTNRETPTEGIPYFEEAAAIYRTLAAGGADEYLNDAMRAFSRLGLFYSLAHADDLALAVRHEAATLARRVASRPADTDKKILMALASGLAEVGQFAKAVTVQLELVDTYRATGSGGSHPQPAGVMWSLLDLAIYLDLAGQSDASMQVEHEALALQRRMSEADPGWLTTHAIWTAGSSLRFLDSGHPQRARELLQESVAACDQLPAEGSQSNFGFHQAVQASLFARSGTADERPEAGRAIPIGVDPRRPLQPVHGLGLHCWSFSVRKAYRAGLDAIDQALDEATAAGAGPLPSRQDRLAQLATLIRRRAIRASVLFDGPTQFQEEVTPALAHNVDLERRLLAIDPDRGARRLIRALTDRAMGHLVTGANNSAGHAISEALALYSAVGDPTT